MKPSMKRWQPPAAPTMGLMALASLALCGQAQAYNCTGVETWTASKAYSGGAVVQNAGAAYSAKWWTQNQNPATTSGQWDVWKPLGACDGVAVNQPPVAAFTTTPSGLSVSFDGSGSTDKDGSIASYAWTFGDGGTATGAKASRTYAAAGTYSVVLTVTDDKGAKTSLTKSVTVSSTPPVNQPPVAAFTSTASGLAVAFDGSGSSDKDGGIASYAWTFGDGGTATGAKASRTYAAAGTYNVVLTVTDDKGAKTSLTRSVSVTAGGDTGADAACRPDGLYVSPGTSPAYCKVYDTSGREKMGADHPRRIIGYFTSWRTGKDGSPAYLASQIPWNKVTHINYAFAHLENNQLSVGNAADANNPATGLTWPGVAGAEMDPSFSYKGHFNLLNKFKKQYPNVKTLVSVGGWAETGGHFDTSGKRVASGGFYTMTTNADNSVNTAGINT
ncbi:MAG: PKD domain-containing protein, partial [Burkholderiaceae bacterium]